MVLEATMIIVDNSESSRNGDYLPTRFGAQSEAVTLIFNAKRGANPESSVGLMSMGGKGPEVLVTFTTELSKNFGKVLEGVHETKIKGSSHLATGISVAALALKHRQNRGQRQRIIVFSCSPIADSADSLIKLAKKMKKNNISVDFVAFGDLEPDTKSKLEAFNEHVKGGEGSYLAIVPPGPNLLSDSLLTTPIMSSGEGGGPASGSGLGADGVEGLGGGASGAAGGYEFGFNPETDPELAMALRMSMEEETNRVERQRREQDEKERKEKEQQEKGKLDGIPEEAQPLLGEDGEASGGGSGSKQPTVEDDKKEDEDPDKMDTA